VSRNPGCGITCSSKGRGIHFEPVAKDDYDHVVGKKFHRNPLRRQCRGKFLRRGVLIVCQETQALRRGVTLVLPSSHAGKKMYVIEGKRPLVQSVDDAVRGRHDKVRRNQCPCALPHYSVAGDIDLADGVPGRPLLLETHPIVLTNDAGV
jgi:hypothetical protein